MKSKCIALISAVSLSVSIGIALADHQPGHKGSHQHETAAENESVHADVKKYKDCEYCGMNRDKFSHSRILVTYLDGKIVGTCSIACLVTELKANQGKKVKTIQVGDYNTKKLIDARKAIWVIGGDQRGVMTKTAKWAFESKVSAKAFIKKHGGTISTYEEALRQSEEP